MEERDYENVKLPVNVKVTLLPTAKSTSLPQSSKHTESKFEDFLSYKIESITANHIIDIESLKIPNTLFDFKLNINVSIIDADGTILETAIHSVMALLLNTKLPNIKITNERKVEMAKGDTEYIKIKNNLISSGYGIYEEMLIPDPTSEEENIMRSFINVTCDRNGKIYGK